MKRSYILILFTFLALACKQPQVVHIDSLEALQAHGTELPALSGNAKLPCYSWEYYVPSPENSAWFEMERIRINFHSMYDDAMDKLPPESAIRLWLWNMVENAELRLEKNPKMNLPEGNDTPNYDPMFRYQITPSPDTNNIDGHYIHVDNELSYYVNKGRNSNNYTKEVINKYAVHNDTILNVFVMPVHPDSVASKTYKQHNAGIALGNSIKISGFFEKEPKFWEYASMFNHEVGHVYGLAHAWNKSDGCEDTPVNPNCFQHTGVPPCDGAISNNLMDYNNSQMAMTPCQIGKVHRNIHDIQSPRRKLVIPRWCTYKPNKPIVISTDTEWNGDKDLNRDIIVKAGATLSLSCRISMAGGSSIVVERGGRIILDNVHLHNDCGDNWQGIRVQTVNQQESICYRGTNMIENVAKHGA